MMKTSLVSIALLAAACAAPEPPPPVPATPNPPPPPVVVTAPVDPDAGLTVPQRFAKLRDKILDQWQIDDPSSCRQLGIHACDGKVADYSEAGLTARWTRDHEFLDTLAKIDTKALSPDDLLDWQLLKAQAEMTLFHAEDMDDFHKNPRAYEDLFGVNAYTDRDYAPVAERLAKLVEHEKNALSEAQNLSNIKGPLSKPLVETSIKIFKGYASYLRGDVVKQMTGVGSPELQAEFSKTNEALAKVAEGFAARLEKDELPRGDASYVLGKDRYKKLLRVQEGLDISLDDFKKMGEDNLAENKKAYLETKKKAHFTRPTIDKLMDAATKLTEEAREFVIEKKIATIPTDDKAVVKETPPYQRWNAAFLDPPGPYEPKATTAFFYITKPDPTWPKKEQLDYITPFGILMSTTVHEVYPGHFLQGQWIKKAPTRAQKSIGSYSFIEGWAHYGEQLMVEQGFLAKDPQNKLGQLSDALLRNCRFVVSLGIHTEGMTLDQAEKRFMDDCFQDKATAREQAVRGTFDPGYFAYTLGKIQILKLRDEAKKKLGDKFDLQKFDDAILSHGSPPVPLIHDRVLADLGAG